MEKGVGNVDIKTINRFEELKPVPRFNTKLRSGFDPLDSLLEGGLQEGELSEWGMPWGRGLRGLILPFLSYAQKSCGYWILWVSGHERVTINPWAWHARSIDLDKIRFVGSQDPMHELRQLFLSDFFRVIVLDQIPRLREEDCQHLARHARTYGLSILILRPYALTNAQGNIWARLRLNCSHDWPGERMSVEVLKGHTPKTLSFAADDMSFFREESWAF